MSPALPPPSLPPAYEGLASLGSGAFGEVWRAHHARFGEVAVKLLAAGTGDRDAAWRFGAEHRRLATLDLPSVPRALERGLTAAGAPWFAMTLMPGCAPAGPWPAARVRATLAALAAALAGLHAASLVHGDVKAENVLVDDAGGVSLLDLAFAAPIGAPREGFIGTPSHLAPEAWRGAPYAPAADWYALGALAHALWTGEAPFPVTGAALARAHADAPPPAIPAEADDPALARAIATLLAKAPASRAAALAELGVVPARPTGLLPTDLPPTAAAEAAGEAALARGSTTWIKGERGAGKSRLLDAWRAIALRRGLAWPGVVATGVAPGASARALVRAALAAAGLAPGPGRDWLAGELPPAWAELEPRARRAAIAAIATDELRRALAAPDGPTVLAVDDVDQADEASRALLDHLRAATPGATWILTATDPPAGEPTHVLPPWTPAEITALAAARLGGPPPDALGAALRAHERPGAADEALRRWHAAGALARTADGWRFDPAAADASSPPPVAPALAALIALAGPAGGLPVAALDAPALGGRRPIAWQSDLDALLASGWAQARDGLVRPRDAVEAQGALAALAEAERPAAAEELARAAAEVGAPLGVIARLALAGEDAALAAGQVRLAAEAALAEFDLSEALTLLDAARAAAPEAGDAATRLALAGIMGEAYRYADRRALAEAAYDRAIALADAAGEPLAAARARIGRAKCRQLSGDPAGAEADAARAEADAEAAGGALVAARAAVARARILLHRGDASGALGACARGVAAARGAQDGPAARVVLAAALNLAGSMLAEVDPARSDEARAQVAEAIDLARAAGDRLGHAAALESLGNVHLATGDLPAARDAFAAHAAVCEAAQAPTERLSGQMNLAIALAALGDPAARPTAAGVAAEAIARGRPFVAALARAAEGEAAFREADWQAVWPALDDALARAETAANRYAATLVRHARLEAAAGMGDVGRLKAELAALGPAGADASAETRAAIALARAWVALLTGDAIGAAALAGPLAGAPGQALARRALHALGEAAAAQGDGEAAARRFAAAAEIAERWDARWHREAAWLGLARVVGAGRAEGWLARILDPDAEAGNPGARAAAAAMRVAAGRAPGAQGHAALAAWQAAVGPLDAAARMALGRAWGVPSEGAIAPSGGAIAPEAIAPWLAAIGLAEDEDALHDALLGAVLDLAGLERGYVLAYEGGHLARIATRRIDFEAELAEGFSTTIADEALITGEPVYVVDAAGAERYRAAASVVALGLRSVVALPYATATEILGVVYADRTALDPLLAPVDLVLLGLLAACAAERALWLRATARLAIAPEPARAARARALARRRAPRAPG